MKKAIVLLIIALALGVFLWQSEKTATAPLGGSGISFSYSSVSMASSSVGIYSWSEVVPAESQRGYVSLCNSSIASNDTVYLAFGTASTTANLPAKPFGYRLPSGQCYEMTLDKMFYGSIYAIASTATTTLLKVTGSY